MVNALLLIFAAIFMVATVSLFIVAIAVIGFKMKNDDPDVHRCDGELKNDNDA